MIRHLLVSWRSLRLEEALAFVVAALLFGAIDLAALLDSLAIGGPVHVTGAGVGGGLSIAFAARRPERVARMRPG